jgi:hypothetical protein
LVTFKSVRIGVFICFLIAQNHSCPKTVFSGN